MNLNFKSVEAEDMSRLRPFMVSGPIGPVTAYSWTLFYGKITIR